MTNLKNLVVVALFGLLTSATLYAQDTSSSSTIENELIFGNCAVFDSVDMFTDAVTNILLCSESTFADKTEIAFVVQTERFYVYLSKGIQFLTEDQVEVAVRVDRNQLRSGTWYYDNPTDRAVFPNDSEIFNTFLTEIHAGSESQYGSGMKMAMSCWMAAQKLLRNFVDELRGIRFRQGQ